MEKLTSTSYLIKMIIAVSKKNMSWLRHDTSKPTQSTVLERESTD